MGKKLCTDFPRPPREVVELFRGIPSTNINDCLSERRGIDAALRPVNSAPLLGTAFTARVTPGENLMFQYAVDVAAPGDVIVVDAEGFTGCALLGELMATHCKLRGIAGLIFNGAVRDIDALRQMDLPIYARGVSPNKPGKTGPGELNVPVTLGGVTIAPGDILCGDADGVVVVRPGEAVETAAKAKAHVEGEVVKMARIRADGRYDRPFVVETLRQLGYDV